MTIGILTEKPSASRNFAAALGGMAGNFQGQDYKITAARGHLYEFADPAAMVAPTLAEQYKSWELEHLPWNPADFAWKRVMKQGAQATVKDIKTTLSACDEIVIATDVDPSGEGDLIFWAIIDELKLHGKKFSRMEFTDEAAPSLQKAFLARRPVKSMQSEAAFRMADFRTKFDLLSMQWTRIATKTAGQRAVLRQGRLKSAMIKLVGDQLKAHNDYQKIPFYGNRFRDENGVVYINPEEPVFADRKDVPAGYTPSPVVLDNRSLKRQAPPRLLDLAGLSARLSTKGVKASMVLATYQKMYEDQVVSYPRTEDKTITTEQFNQLLPHVDKIAAVVGADVSLLTQRTPRKTHVKDSGAHGANRPGPNVPASLDALKAKYGVIAPLIYEELGRSYLAMLAEDYVYERQEGHLAKYPPFKGASNVPKSLGYKAIFDTEEAEEKDEVESAAGLGTNADPFVHEGFPKRPVHPSMKWLMKQLEKRDVGTGATRTSTYAEVTNEKAKYPLLSEKRGKITMAECGEMGYRLLPGTHIGDLSVTEFVQGEMKAVAAGTKTADDALRIVADWVIEDITVMQANAVTMRKELGMTTAPVQTREKFEGCFKKTGELVSFNRVWGTNEHWKGHRFTDDECEKLLDGAVISFDAISKKKSEYTAVGTLEEGTFNGRSFHGFKLDFDKQDPAASLVPKTMMGHRFTADERKSLEAGKKIYVDGLKSSKGNTFGATLYIGIKDGETKKRVLLDFGK
ncbi:DNA topoisomerase [Arthrobacter koreensis]|uniref:DNA topoisomerase n=1 Tax=Arthrobacter koreensis TaxID=199136 RepID=UPI0038049030